jgi:hypothetical protein
LRPKSAIGQPYVELRPGKDGAPIPDHGRLDIAASSAAIQLDRVLSTFDAESRRHFQSMMRELGKGTLGTGEGLNDGIAVAPRGEREFQQIEATLTADPHTLPRFVHNSADLATTFARMRNQLAGTFKPSSEVMRTLTSERVALAQTLDVAPATLTTVTRALAHVDPALRALRAFAQASLPPLRVAPGALRETTGMLRTARTSVPPVNRTLHLADAAVAPTLKLLTSARKAAPWIDGALKAALPNVEELAPRRCDIVRMVRNWQNMFAFGEPKAHGGNTLAVDVASPGQSSFGGNRPGIDKLDVPYLVDAYPGPCVSYNEVHALSPTVARNAR